MSDTLSHWLKSHTRIPGILACAVCMPDKTTCAISHSDQYPLEALTSIWRCLSDTFEVAVLHHIAARNLRWVYEHTQLYCVKRNDRVFLAVLLENQPHKVDLAGVEQLFVLFKSLRLN